MHSLNQSLESSCVVVSWLSAAVEQDHVKARTRQYLATVHARHKGRVSAGAAATHCRVVGLVLDFPSHETTALLFYPRNVLLPLSPAIDALRERRPILFSPVQEIFLEAFGQPVEKVAVVDDDVAPGGRIGVFVRFRREDQRYDAFLGANLVYDVRMLRANDAWDSEAFFVAEVAVELESGCRWLGHSFLVVLAVLALSSSVNSSQSVVACLRQSVENKVLYFTPGEDVVDLCAGWTAAPGCWARGVRRINKS